MKCPTCGEETPNPGAFITLVAARYITDEQGREHIHDDNCAVRRYECANGHTWSESKRRRCTIPDCDWKGKAECFCHGGVKVDEWTDGPEERDPDWEADDDL